MDLTIYHNPRCSKSRQTLALLQARGLEPKIVEYLKTPPDHATIKQLLDALGVPAIMLLRSGESVVKESGIELDTVTEETLIDFMHRNPIAIQRPIVVVGDEARIGRPPEEVLEILSQ